MICMEGMFRTMGSYSSCRPLLLHSISKGALASCLEEHKNLHVKGISSQETHSQVQPILRQLSSYSPHFLMDSEFVAIHCDLVVISSNISHYLSVI